MREFDLHFEHGSEASSVEKILCRAGKFIKSSCSAIDTWITEMSLSTKNQWSPNPFLNWTFDDSGINQGAHSRTSKPSVNDKIQLVYSTFVRAKLAANTVALSHKGSRQLTKILHSFEFCYTAAKPSVICSLQSEAARLWQTMNTRDWIHCATWIIAKTGPSVGHGWVTKELLEDFKAGKGCWTSRRNSWSPRLCIATARIQSIRCASVLPDWAC